MLLSSNSGLYGARRGKPRFDMLEAVDFCANVGFQAIDVSFCGTIYTEPHRNDPILDGDWRGNIERIALRAAERGIRLEGSHLPYFNYLLRDDPDFAFRHQMQLRALEAAALLDCKWTVLHPLAEDIEAAVDYIKFFLDAGAKFGIGVALENMPHMQTETLLEFVEKSGAEGICWDVGHGNLNYDSQYDEIMKVGDKLKMLHVHDNNGKKDEHHAPFIGTTDWQSVMTALRDCGYTGAFNYEVNDAALPDELRVQFAAYLIAAARHLFTLMDDSPS